MKSKMNMVWPESFSGYPGMETGFDIAIETDDVGITSFGLEVVFQHPGRFQIGTPVPGSLIPSGDWCSFGSYQIDLNRLRIIGFCETPLIGRGKFITIPVTILNTGNMNSSRQSIENLQGDIIDYFHNRIGVYSFRFAPGDVNQDFIISAGDAQLAFMIALGQHIPTDQEFQLADFDGNGIVTVGDAQAIFRKALGLKK